MFVLSGRMGGGRDLPWVLPEPKILTLGISGSVLRGINVNVNSCPHTYRLPDVYDSLIMVEFVELATIGARVNLAVELGPGEGHSSSRPFVGLWSLRSVLRNLHYGLFLRSHKFFIYFIFS